MAAKVFISYSHKDEAFKDDLEEHLAMLKRENLISIWHDRRLVGGQEWGKEIDENLSTSDIILLLISPSFLASDYCSDIEVKKAMEMHESGNAVVIPIIVRTSDWSTAIFSKLQALPKDAKPVRSWDDSDDAWYDVAKGIRTTINQREKKIAETGKELQVLCDRSSIQVSPAIEDWIEDTEIMLTHRKVDKVKLSDIYVYPDLEVEKENTSNIEIEIEDSKKLLSIEGRYLVLGEEQQGKTSLLKQLFKEFATQGVLPLYIDAEGINKANVEKTVEKELERQYINLEKDHFWSSKEKVLLLDNIDRIGLNNKFREIFVDGVSKRFDWVVATCNSAFNYISSEVPALSSYESCDMLGLGNLKREEIIQKWISLGVEESIEESTLYERCDELKSQLNTVIKKNIVPPKPVYVLMIMQMFEAASKQDLELTSFGHCYQQLIYQSFEKAKINPKDYGRYINILTEIAWEIFVAGEGLNEAQIENFFSNYERKYLSINREEILNKLKRHSILGTKNERLNFKYPYIYYFFAGKNLAENYTESQDAREKIETLLQNLHREDYANILIFITHHTKDSWVLSEIKSVLADLFSENTEAELKKEQLSFMDEFMKEIPEIIVEQREIQQERDNQNRALDKLERTEAEEDENPPDTLAKINKSFKGMEIAGQIIRNRHATMTRDALYDLARSGAATGLRFLDFFIKISDTSKNEIIKFISTVLAEHPTLSDREVQDLAKETYLHLTYGVINAVVRKVAFSIGSKEAHEIYEQLEKDRKTPAHTLIYQAIELQFKRELNTSTVKETYEKLKSNPVCLRILKEMVVQHIYMFPVEYREKQQLSSILGISVRGQRQMDLNKRGKG